MVTNTKPYYCCPTCGCTDIEESVWIEMNTKEVVNECCEHCWCSQCGSNDDGVVTAGGFECPDITSILQPFDEDADYDKLVAAYKER